MNKVIFIIPLIAISFLVNCGEKKPEPKPDETFTITINETRHFHPSASTLTFKKNTFNPIILPYKIDDGFVVTETVCDDKENECDFNYLKKELTITPHKNADFCVNVSVTSFTQVSYVAIANTPKHFFPNKSGVPFVKGDYKQITFTYTIDNYCSISAKVSAGTAKCDLDTKNQKIVVTPQSDDDIAIEITIKEEYKIVKFNPNSGKLGDDAKEELFLPFGKTWGECVNSSTQIATLGERKFAGWSSNRFIYNEIITDDYVIDENIPDTVYAIFYHNIELHSKSLKLKEQVYVQNEHLHLYFDFENIEHYKIPEADDIKLYNEEAKKNFQLTFNYDYQPGASEIHIEITTPMSEIKYDIIEVWVTDYIPEYSCEQTLENLTLEKEKNPKRGDDFVFTLTANNIGNDIYTVPHEIGIKINDAPIVGLHAYTIEDISKDHDFTKAKVTILGRFIKGDVHIVANAVTYAGYHLIANGYGVTCSETSKYIPYTEANEIELFGSEASVVTSSNILIRINGTNWYTCDALPEPYNTVISYDQSNHKIIISQSAECIQTVTFYVFSPNYSIFQKASWETIGELATLPTEQIMKFFKIGETRDVEDERYSFRIIDFSHDNLSDGSGKAGMTIETIELATYSYELKPILHHYSDETKEHGCYINGPLDNFLKNDFSSHLPSDLRYLLKTVSKPCIEHSKDEYGIRYKDVNEDVDIFAISSKEYNLEESRGEWNHEGKPYEYYKSKSSPDLIKYPVGTNVPAAYWTRGHSESYTDDAKYIEKDGNLGYGRVNNDRGIAPAFCI